MLQSMYQAVSSRLARVPFAQIWPGFSPDAFALYQGQLACIAGALQPRPQSFLGNTALPWQGGYLAIWELEGEEDPDHLAANLVHELFHVYQFTCRESRFPQDIPLLLSPAPPSSLASRMQEGALLAQAVTADPSMALECLSQFCALRRQRQDSPEWEQECLVETAEGMAEFADLSALEALAPEKYRAQLDRSRAILQNRSLLAGHRHDYYSGALLCLEFNARFELRHSLSGQSRLAVFFLDRAIFQLPPVPRNRPPWKPPAAVAAAQESAPGNAGPIFRRLPSCQRGRFQLRIRPHESIYSRQALLLHFLAALSDLKPAVIHPGGQKPLFACCGFPARRRRRRVPPGTLGALPEAFLTSTFPDQPFQPGPPWRQAPGDGQPPDRRESSPGARQGHPSGVAGLPRAEAPISDRERVNENKG